MNNGILEGIKVVDLSRYISGPNACSLLGNLGADVIKVESPDGEPVRRSTVRAFTIWSSTATNAA